MGKISVDAFIREYGVAAKQKGSAMDSFIGKHITTKYIDFIKKSVICEGIVDTTCHIIDGKKKLVKINNANRNLFFIMKLIENYTDIEFANEKVVETYDKLNEVGAIDVILDAIPDLEYSEFQNILNMKMNDFRDNEYSLTAILYNLKESLSISEEVINSVIGELQKETNND